MTWLKVLVVASLMLMLLFLLVLRVLARQPWRHRNLTPDRLRALLTALLDRGVDGSLLYIDVPRTEKFLQFRLEVSERQRTIISGFPLAPWSMRHSQQVTRLLEDKRIQYDVSKGEGDEGLDFILVEFGDDVALAQVFASAMLTSVFQVSPERDAVAKLLRVRD